MSNYILQQIQASELDASDKKLVPNLLRKQISAAQKAFGVTVVKYSADKGFYQCDPVINVKYTFVRAVLKNDFLEKKGYFFQEGEFFNTIPNADAIDDFKSMTKTELASLCRDVDWVELFDLNSITELLNHFGLNYFHNLGFNAQCKIYKHVVDALKCKALAEEQAQKQAKEQAKKLIEEQAKKTSFLARYGFLGHFDPNTYVYKLDALNFEKLKCFLSNSVGEFVQTESLARKILCEDVRFCFNKLGCVSLDCLKGSALEYKIIRDFGKSFVKRFIRQKKREVLFKDLFAANKKLYPDGTGYQYIPREVLSDPSDVRFKISAEDKSKMLSLGRVMAVVPTGDLRTDLDAAGLDNVFDYAVNRELEELQNTITKKIGFWAHIDGMRTCSYVLDECDIQAFRRFLFNYSRRYRDRGSMELIETLTDQELLHFLQDNNLSLDLGECRAFFEGALQEHYGDLDLEDQKQLLIELCTDSLLWGDLYDLMEGAFFYQEEVFNIFENEAPSILDSRDDYAF